MKIKNKVLKFKSVSSMFYKERIGSKPNTVRIITQGEMVDIIQCAPYQIMICESATNRNFIRTISDISYFVPEISPKIIICIISWYD